RGGDGAVPVRQKDRVLGGDLVGGRDVGIPVAVEVGDGNRGRTTPGAGARRRCEGAVAVAQQDRDVVGAVVGDRQVALPVAVEVADGNRLRMAPGVVVHRRGEGGVAGAQQDRYDDGVAVDAEHPDLLAVAVSVADGR